MNTSTHSKYYCSTITGRYLYMLWTWVNTWTVLGVVMLTYAGFYWLTIDRFQDQGLLLRMRACAELLTLEANESDKTQVAVRVHDLINKYHAYGFRFHPYKSSNEADGAETNEVDADNVLESVPESFVDVFTQLACHEPPSHEFTEAAHKAARELNRWGPSIEKASGFLSRFTRPSYVRSGVRFVVPAGDLSNLRKDAALFLTHQSIFSKNPVSGNERYWAGFRNAPLKVKLAPWELLRFFDETRYNLNNKLPLAVGTLLLAASFLLQFRLVDYAKPRTSRDKALMQYKPRSYWIPIWEKARHTAAEDSSLFNHTRLRLYTVAGSLLMLTVELFMNLPVHRQEWIFNAPLMLMTGAALPVIWVTLWQLGKRRLNPTLSTCSKEFRRRVLRPLVYGVLILAVVSVWGMLYSLFDLPGGNSERLRAIIQLIACTWTLCLLLRLFFSLNQQLRKLDSPGAKPLERVKPPDARDEPDMNPPESDIVAEFFPGIDERAINAALLALLPVPMIVQSLIQ
ncbi:MAG: hypothetical protein JNG86_17165 [Verrucomicrobiaceae bacterium]|nr:hypothetical protein [Verrucomicrobiaceae bacterium]